MTYKIIVAEDDRFLANAYRVKLEKEGFEIKIASDGTEVFDILKSYKPDVILLDLVMPVMDGFTTLEKLKNDSATQNIPVLIASNLGQKEDMDRSLSLGANGFVVKSDTTLDEIIVKINSVLKKNG